MSEFKAWFEGVSEVIDKASTEKLTEPERLRREADELDRQAEHLKHSSWLGEPPWRGVQQDAADKRLLANLLERNLKAKGN